MEEFTKILTYLLSNNQRLKPSVNTKSKKFFRLFLLFFYTSTMKKEKIHNTFFDLIAFILSIIANFFRSIKSIFTLQKNKKNIFFNFIDFLVRIWPKYFWKKPTFYKFTSFIWDIFTTIFKKK